VGARLNATKAEPTFIKFIETSLLAGALPKQGDDAMERAMTKIMGSLAAAALCLALSLPGSASATESQRSDGLRNETAKSTEVSAQRRWRRSRVVRRYYRYPRRYAYPRRWYRPRAYAYAYPYYRPYYGWPYYGPTFSFGFRF
jgi:hypothetical protein